MITAIGRHKKLTKICMGIMALVLTGAVFFILWRNGVFLPRWIDWENSVINDDSGEYEIRLSHRMVKVDRGGETVWTSPREVKVQKVLSCDIDRDQTDELILLCWKRGRYGKFRPFWVEKDEKTWSQHLFVYEYGPDRIHPKWMASDLGQYVKELAACDSAIAGYRLLMVTPEGKKSSWIWDSWGFTKVDTDVSFTVFGDNLLHESIYQYGLQKEKSFAFLYEGVQEMITQSDVAVINQETPLVDNPSLYGGYPRFGTPIQAGEAIADAGFQVVTCATNHALDRGSYGVDTTKQFFDSRKIKCLGIQTEDDTEYRPCQFVVKKGIRFALLNYTYGTNGIRVPEENPYMVHLLQDEEQVREDLAAAREAADAVIVFVHWGTENDPEIDAFQEKWTKVFRESKVDVVVGTHPHIVQPCEFWEQDGQQMLIYYSIGNFISAQQEESVTKGGAAKFTISMTPEGYRVSDYSLVPLVITRQENGGYTVQPKADAVY